MTRGLNIAVLCVALTAGCASAEEGADDAARLRTFRAVCAARSAAASEAETITVVGRDGWLFLGPGLRHLSVAEPFWGASAAKVSRAARPEYADPLPAIVDFKTQLDALGIDLLVVPVPDKAVIYPDALDASIRPGRPRLDAVNASFYAVLRDKNVAVLDLTPAFLAEREASPPPGQPLYCRTDTHWSPRACVLTAELIAKVAAGRPWLADVKKTAFVREPRTIEITGDLARALPETADRPSETLTLRVIAAPGPAATRPVADDRDSPVLLLGDSHCLVFHVGGDMHAESAGLADQLTAELGFAVDVLGVRGSAATAARASLYRRAQADPQYLARKKLIIWCFAAREFTEAQGWRKWPVAPPAE